MRDYPSQSATKRISHRIDQRPAVFVPLGPDDSPATVLSALELAPGKVAHVYLCGNRPSAGWEDWSRSFTPHEWSLGACYFEGAPVMRWERRDHARVEVHSAAAWFGPTTPDDAGVCARAWDALADYVEGAFAGGTLLATPATTGRVLFGRSIPRGREFPILHADTQELIRATSGQGRVEVLRGDQRDLTELHEYDGRLMYAALCWELPLGQPTRDTINEFAGHQRGRYLVTVKVPRDWPHNFGLIGEHAGDDGWRYPCVPGMTFRTWADGSELLIAQRMGWTFTVEQRLLFERYTGKGPLDTWALKLCLLRDRVEREHPESELGRRVRFAIRSIVLHGIGAFQGGPHLVTRSLPIERANETPANARNARVEGAYVVWAEERASWQQMQHPEWCAAIWSRARARLLAAPGRTGALHVKHGRVVAFRTDAIYVDRLQPWKDDGRAGRFRLVRSGSFDPPAPYPHNGNELLALRRELVGLGDGR